VGKSEVIVAVAQNFHYPTVRQVNVMATALTIAAQSGAIVDLELITVLVQNAKISGLKVKG